MKQPVEELIYAPARRRGIGLLIMLAGPSGSGKTKSALRLATGLAGGGEIDACDTEHGRMLYYADDFKFNHLELKEPFRPSRFENAAVTAQRRKSAVWVCDSFSHEHVGPGGVLDMHEAILQRMVESSLKKTPGNEWERREVLNYASWIEPKGEHKHLLQRLWQLNTHIILCCHAELKLELVKNEKGKTVPKPDRDMSPVCSPDIPYAMSFSLMFDAKNPGVPRWLKRFDKVEPFINFEKPIDEETGARLAEWARGAKPSDSHPRAQESQPKTSVESAPQPPPDDGFPGDMPAGELALGDAGTAPPKGKNEAVLQQLIDQFVAVKVRADHLAIVDKADNRQKIEWFKRNKPQLHARLRTAMESSWNRTNERAA